MRARFLAVVVVAACTRAEAPPVQATSDRIEVGQLAPAYAATAMNGDSVSLASLRGNVVMLNVWATWCGPCRKEIPELRAIHDRYKGRGLHLIGVSVDADGSEEAIRAFATDFQMNYAIWRDPGEAVSAIFRMSGVPATFVIDRQGLLRWKATGAVEPGDTSLTNAIEKALGEG